MKANSQGSHISSAARRVVVHAAEQGAIHLHHILWTQEGVRGTMGANTCLHAHSNGGQRGNMY